MKHYVCPRDHMRLLRHGESDWQRVLNDSIWLLHEQANQGEDIEVGRTSKVLESLKIREALIGAKHEIIFLI